MNYDQDYFERGIETGKSAYQNYRWIPELTIPLAHQIIIENNIESTQCILDFGCAKGYLVKAFRLLGYVAHGVDISDYAIRQAPTDVKQYLTRLATHPDSIYGKHLHQMPNYDWIIAKDVFEHIKLETLKNILIQLSALGDYMFAIIPLGKKGRYNAETNNMDPSHMICEDADWWTQLFDLSGWEPIWYRSQMKHIKQSYNDIKDAHGFFKLKSTKQ